VTIAPSYRLLSIATCLLPAAGLLAALFSAPLIFVFSLAFLVVVAGIDLLLSADIFEGLDVQLPEIIRLSKDKKGEIPVRIVKGGAKKLRIGFPFPPEIHSIEDEAEVILPADSPYALFAWRCTPSRRGRYVVDRCFVGLDSPLGLWRRSQSFFLNSEIRVYPNLTGERKKMAALFLNRKDAGIHSQRMIGQGREFEKLRDYIPGDAFDQIHWKATAKRGRPVTKIFQVERTQEVYVVVDSSRLIAKELDGQSTLEYFARSALLLGMIAQRQGDLFGAITFSDKVHGFLRAGNGKAHYNACRDLFYALDARLVTPDFEELFSFIRLRLRRRALLIILTDLNDPVLAESFVRSCRLISRQHLVLVNMVRPSKSRPLFTEPDAVSMEDIYSNLSGHILWHNLQELQRILRRNGIRLRQMDPSAISAEMISQYFSIKQRQLI